MTRTDNVSIDSRHHSWILAARGQVEDSEAREASFPRRGGRAGLTLPANFFPGYELRGEIHRGGQGIVYQAIQKSTGRTVAIKMLREAAFAGPTERSRFEREVQVLAALKHPNIVTIHDSGNAAGHLYFVMDFIAGRPLDAYVAGEKPPVREMLRLFATICDAVNAAHVLGIVHRDLKPGNIRVGANGTPYVLDFGLARLTDASAAPAESDSPPPMTVTGQFVGSLPWATPEQADGEAASVDRRSDVYSLGVVLFQVLTGRFPYPVTGKIRQVLDSIAGTAPADPRSLSNAIDDEVATIVLTCLAKDPTRRYQSAGELAADIRRYLAGEPIAAKRDSTWYMLRKTAARHRAPIAAASVIILLLAISTAVGWSLMLRARASEHAARENLRTSLLAQARARRESLGEGRRTESLDALTRAAAIRPAHDLRGELISTLAVTDILTRPFSPPPPGTFIDTVSRDGSCAMAVDAQQGITLVSYPDGGVLARIPPPPGTRIEQVAMRCDRSYVARLFDRVDGPRRLEVWRAPQSDLLFAVNDVPDRASFDISPDGKTLVIGRTDHAIHFFDLASGAETRRIELDRDPSYLRFDPTGRRLLRFHARDMEASILDLDSGASTRVFGDNPITFAAAWRLDGRMIAAAQGDLIRLWDVDEHREIGPLAGHDVTIVHLAFSPSGRFLYSRDWASSSNLWDLESMRSILRPSIRCANFGADDHYLVGSIPNNGVITAATAELMFDESCAVVPPEFASSGARIQSGALDPSGRVAVASIHDPEIEADGLQFYDIRRRRPMGRIACPDIGSVRFAATGSAMFTSVRNELVRWPFRIDESTVRVGPPQVLARNVHGQFGFSSDGKRVAYACQSDPRLRILDLGDEPRERAVDTMPNGTIVVVSPDGRWATVNAWQSAGAEVWDLDRGAIASKLAINSNVRPFFTDNGDRLIVHESGDLSMYRPGHWDQRRTIKLSLSALTFCSSGFGKMAAGIDDHGAIHLFDGERLDDLASFVAPDTRSFVESMLTADGTTLAAFELRGGFVQLWDLRHIRAALASTGIDWSLPPLPDAPRGDAAPLKLVLDGCSFASPKRPAATAAR